MVAFHPAPASFRIQPGPDLAVPVVVLVVVNGQRRSPGQHRGECGSQLRYADRGLGHNGQLNWLKGGFLGLQDFFDEMTTYSSAADILQIAWQLIQPRVPLNLDVQKNLYTTDSMGTVGNAFQQLVGFQQTFAVNPDDLSDSTGSAVVANNLPSS
jgi:hypothetical protein